MTSADVEHEEATTPSKKQTKKPSREVAPRKTASKSATRKNRKYPWEELRQKFIEGFPKDANNPDGDRDWPNLRELSERTDTPYARIRERSASERWVDLRAAHQTHLAKERQTQRAKTLAGAATEFDDKALNVGKMGVQLITLRLAEIARDVRDHQSVREQAIRDQASGIPIDKWKLYSKINSGELEKLAKSMETFQTIGMRALGTDVERMQVDITQETNIQHTISVAAELERDDPDRLGAFMAAAERAGIWEQLQITAGDGDPEEDEYDGEEAEDIQDAEIVE